MPREDLGFVALLLTLAIASGVAFLWLCFQLPLLGAFSAGFIAVWALVYFVLRKLEHDARCRP